VTSVDDKHRALRACAGRPQQVATASAATRGMPASSTATPLQASVANCTDTQDCLAQAQALVNRLAEASMNEQAQASSADEFAVDWGGSEADAEDTEPEEETDAKSQHEEGQDDKCQQPHEPRSAYRRQGMPSCLVARVGDMYIISTSQASHVASIAGVLQARNVAINVWGQCTAAAEKGKYGPLHYGPRCRARRQTKCLS